MKADVLLYWSVVEPDRSGLWWNPTAVGLISGPL